MRTAQQRRLDPAGTTRPPAALTAADRVTAARLVITLVCGGLGIASLTGLLAPRTWALVALVVLALVLDGVDGAVARGTGCVTDRGARWDVEVDALLVLLVCLPVVPMAPWALAIGLARYAFVAGSLLRSQWRMPLRHSRSRRAIGLAQGIALAVALTPVVPVAAARAVVTVALAALLVSFARDIGDLERRPHSDLTG